MQHELLRVVSAYWTAHGYAPTVRELRDLVGYSSTSTVLYTMRVLRRRGLLQFEDGIARTVRVAA